MARAAVVLGILLVVATTGAAQGRSTLQDVTIGMKCSPNSSGLLECDYRVGRSLHFGIVAIGKPDASIYFYSVSFDGDYFAVVGLSHGCVVVRPGQEAPVTRRADLAFVSPANGKVYSTWEACREGK